MTPYPQTRRRLYAEIILACVLWGSQHPYLKMLSLELPPVVLNAVRFGIGLLCLAPFALSENRTSRRNKQRIALLGVFGIGLFSSLVVEGVRRAGAVHLSLFTNVHPFISTCLAPLLIKEPLQSEKIAASVLGLTGVALIMTNGFQSFGMANQTAQGDLLLLSGALVFSIYTMLGKKYVISCGGLAFTFYSMIGGFLSLTAGALVRGGAPELFQLAPIAWAQILYISIFTVAIAWWLWFRAIGGLGVSTASVFVFLTPLSGVLFSAYVFGEKIGTWTWIGGGFILLALVVNVAREAAEMIRKGGRDANCEQ